MKKGLFLQTQRPGSPVRQVQPEGYKRVVYSLKRVRVESGDFSPEAPTVPYERISRIRFFMSRFR